MNAADKDDELNCTARMNTRFVAAKNKIRKNVNLTKNKTEIYGKVILFNGSQNNVAWQCLARRHTQSGFLGFA